MHFLYHDPRRPKEEEVVIGGRDSSKGKGTIQNFQIPAMTVVRRDTIRYHPPSGNITLREDVFIGIARLHFCSFSAHLYALLDCSGITTWLL